MNSLKNIRLILCLALFSLPSSAAPESKAKNENILCKLFGIGCQVIVKQDTGGDGMEPPKTK